MSIRFGITLDPLHIGAGGYRLGRVDNTIVRDAGTGLPKVPGSSLAGIVRSYVTFSLKDEKEQQKAIACASKLDKDGNPARDKGNCGQCAVCRMFGHSAYDDKSSSHIGLLRFYDGHIIAFPVKTLAGPVWVVSPNSLARVGVILDEQPKEQSLLTNFTPISPAESKEARLNLGWLYLPATKLKNVEGLAPVSQQLAKIMPEAHIAVAPDWLFAEIINSNLEVRTSVHIDFITGAAESGKLFTYEAIPAATLLAFDIELDSYRCEGQDFLAEEVQEAVDEGLKLCGTLGMGGMTTRGFGRVRFNLEGGWA